MPLTAAPELSGPATVSNRSPKIKQTRTRLQAVSRCFEPVDRCANVTKVRGKGNKGAHVVQKEFANEMGGLVTSDR